MKSTFAETITIELTIPEYNRLMLFLGYALGCKDPARELMKPMIEFVNEMNKGNPHYTPYRIERGVED